MPLGQLLAGHARNTAHPLGHRHRAAYRRHRTIFISDTHLGTRGCKAEALADFLAHNDCATLFLVGDIVDGWQLKRRWYWTQAQSQVVARNPAQGRCRHAGDLRARQS